MVPESRHIGSLFSIVLPLVVLVAELAFVSTSGVFSFGFWPFLPDTSVLEESGPATVSVPGGTFSYRPSGAFLKGGNPVDQARDVRHQSGLVVTSDLVTMGAYRSCVGAGACKRANARADTADNVPVTGVSFVDASDYANWLSAQTGAAWRLPTDEEWIYAAGSRATDDAIGETDAKNPSERWLAAYRKSSVIDRSAGAVPQVSGTFGTNEYGLKDFSGNVWEWTSSCYVRVTLNSVDDVAKSVSNCGVRVVEGAHRTYISYFVRDARGGGCSVGSPPDNLGFRLVREPKWTEMVANWLGVN